MASLTIRKLNDNIKQRLRIRAAEHGRSMEEEARMILRQVLDDPHASEKNWVESITSRFQELGGVELELPERQMPREAPDFSSAEYDHS
jgi:plasmid stability protein